MSSITKRNSETWAVNDKVSLDYHTAQWESPKRSTIAFESFVSNILLQSKNIIDMGAGAATAYLASKNKSVNFTAFDYLKELVDMGNKVKAEKKLTT